MLFKAYQALFLGVSANITIYTDGAARGNPGPSASGFKIYGNGKLLHHAAVYNGIKTNNFAEYNAVVLALEWCLTRLHDAKEAKIELFSDSELVVRQINGHYRIKATQLLHLNDRARRLSKEFKSATFKNLPREHPGIVSVDRSLNDLLDRTPADGKTG